MVDFRVVVTTGFVVVDFRVVTTAGVVTGFLVTAGGVTRTVVGAVDTFHGVVLAVADGVSCGVVTVAAEVVGVGSDVDVGTVAGGDAEHPASSATTTSGIVLLMIEP